MSAWVDILEPFLSGMMVEHIHCFLYTNFCRYSGVHRCVSFRERHSLVLDNRGTEAACRWRGRG